MNKILFVEGVPGSGKTTLVNEFLNNPNRSKCLHLIYSANVIPVNLVRQEIKNGRSLSIEEARVVYSSRSYSEYWEEHIDIWNRFCAEKSTMSCDFIVDAGLIQAPLYELLGLYMLNNEEILYHIQHILDIVKKSFIPELIYLQTDCPALCIRTAIEKQKVQREQWVSGFCHWLGAAPYPLVKHYSGINGIEQFVEDRYQVDCFLLENLKVNKVIRYRKII